MQSVEGAKGLTEAVDCPICDVQDFKVVFGSQYPEKMSREKLIQVYHSSSDHLLMDQMVSCNECSLAYLNPRLKSDMILESYSTAVDPVFVKQNELRVATFKRSLKKILKKLDIKPTKEMKVLDVGCAGAAFPKAASDLGFTAQGIEPSKWMVDYGRKTYGLDIKAGILEDFKFAPKSFDLVTFWDVIEHVPSPQDSLKRVHGILKDSGYLIVNYPDYESWACKIMGKRWPFFLSVHLFYFSPKTIKRLLDKAGFELVSLTPYWQTLQLGYVLKRASAYVKPLGLAEKLVTKMGLGELPLTYNLGQTLVIARKKK